MIARLLELAGRAWAGWRALREARRASRRPPAAAALAPVHGSAAGPERWARVAALYAVRATDSSATSSAARLVSLVVVDGDVWARGGGYDGPGT